MKPLHINEVIVFLITVGIGMILLSPADKQTTETGIAHSTINESGIIEQKPLLKVRSLKILSLGGSTTWGAKLSSRKQTYPERISSVDGSINEIFEETEVVNIAMRATGSDYAALCIESMILEGLQSLRQTHSSINGQPPSTPVKEIEKTYNFDVITLEFSLNGLDRMTLLLQRLKERYPHALFIYIHLWSPRMTFRNKVTGQAPRDFFYNNENENKLSFREIDNLMTGALSDPDATWEWDWARLQNSITLQQRAEENMKLVNGYLWSFPLDQDDDPGKMLEMFSEDGHHLNDKGHDIVAIGIKQFLFKNLKNLYENQKMADSTQPLNWGKGDQCISWFETGQSPLQHIGGKMKMFVKYDKWAHHISIGNSTAGIGFVNESEWPMPLSVMYMVWTPGFYPKTKVIVMSTSTTPGDIDSGFREQIDKEEGFLLTPLHMNSRMQEWHVTQTTQVGYAQPGRNTVFFDCLEKTVKPLRITAIVMCGQCQKFKLIG